MNLKEYVLSLITKQNNSISGTNQKIKIGSDFDLTLDKKAGLKPLIPLEYDNHNEISKSIPLGFLSPISVQTNKATPLRKVFTKLRLNLGKRESRHLKTFSVSLQISNKTLTITLRHFAYKLLLEFKPGEKFVSLGKLVCTILLDVKNPPSFQL